MNIGETLQVIYDSEINCRLFSEWDDGWKFQFGDIWNGFGQLYHFDTIEELNEALPGLVKKVYPRSTAAKRLNPRVTVSPAAITDKTFPITVLSDTMLMTCAVCGTPRKLENLLKHETEFKFMCKEHAE